MQKIRKCIGAIALLLQISSFAVAQVNYPFRDTTLSHHERIKDLLSRLNVSEKISLLRATSPAIPRLGIDKYYHGNEALHGVVRPGKFTVFPQAIVCGILTFCKKCRRLFRMRPGDAGMS